jgi:hypothetical protein
MFRRQDNERSTRRRVHARFAAVGAALIPAIAAAVLIAPTPALAAVPYHDVPQAGWRVNGPTYAVRVVGSRVYVGGTFSQATGPGGVTRPRANMAAFDLATGALVEGFRADTNGSVRSIVSDGTTVYLGGSFTSVSGGGRGRMAAVSATTGALLPFNPNANNIVYSLDLRAGRLFAGGVFSTIGGVARNRAAAVNPATGALDPQFTPQPNNTVLSIRSNPSGNTVYLAGDLSAVAGTARAGVAAVSGATGALLPLTFSDTYRPTLGLDMNEDGSRLYGAVGALGNQVAAWSTTSGTRVWRQRADGDVQAVAYHNGTVYWGFHEAFEGDTTLRLLASNAVTGAIDPDFRPTFNQYWGVRSISATDDGLAVGGEFTNVTGVPAQGVAIFPGVPTVPPTQWITASTPWSYLAQATAPNAGWQQAGFDDSSWPAGTGQFGYGDGDETTAVPFGPNAADKWVTTYFRASFTVANQPASATLSVLVDDGAVVYLNGVELLRDNMPAGTVGWGTLAASNRSGTAENEWRPFTVPAGLLAVGLNTIAIEVHQDAAGSSDLSFDARLEGAA